MPKKAIDNQGKACDAVVRALEERASATRSNPRYPERDGSGPPVEYVFKLGDTTYALEHTIIEAFERQIHTGLDFENLVKPVQEALDHHMPTPGMYRLTFPIDPCAGLKPRDIPKAQEIIIAWVREKAAELHAISPERPHRLLNPYGKTYMKQEVPPGLGFELHLVRDTMPGLADGRLFIGRFAPEDYQELRVKRLERTFDTKLPKLAGWKERGAVSVLILENRDIALTNHNVVANVTERILRARNSHPDEIWLVDTCTTSWFVRCLLRDGMIFPDENSPIRYRELNPTALCEV